MIQRRQSLYLFLAALIAALLLILNLSYFKTDGTLENGETATIEVGYFTSQWDQEPPENNSKLIGSLAAYAGIMFITIFFFKNRRRQIMFCTLAFAFLILSVVMMYQYSYGINYFESVGSQNLQWTAIIPISLFILNFLALQGIKNDEALVKSLDRLR